ncbi:AT-rich interactive domain-containing protein 4B [Gonioctena quinquepunctata]|nr:AT-rich interactive domain-containing protein 4B [Gonioctena quinquepunctata]
MQADDPPYLSVGTAVSAKYKGAFCEAKVSKVVRTVKCKVTYKMGLGSATLSDEQIKGTLRVGQLVQAKHSDRKELVEATITKIQDCSQYTVVFDDGDITTLRRTALCLKSGRHFNESETLDQLPLTHPEHFGNPVVGGRRGRRSRQAKEASSDEEVEEENEPDLEAYLLDIKRVVSVEASDKKRSKDNWFPGLVVIPSAQPTVRINMKDEYLIRSFKDGRYYTVPKKEVSVFSREIAGKVESSILAEAIQKALRFLDHNDLPPHWEKSSLFHSHSIDSESDENFTDSSDDEPSEEKDRFVAQLYKFMDDAGTPLNKTPTIANRDIDLHRLFRAVQKLGGHNRVTNQNKWRTVTSRLHLPNNQNTFNQVKAVYKKCLSSYETFYRTLGVTMLNHTREPKKNKGRSLIRDRDRSTPINSPGPEKEEEPPEEKKEIPVQQPQTPVEPLKSKRIEKRRAMAAAAAAEVSDTSSDTTTDHSEPAKDTSKLKKEKPESKSSVVEKKPKAPSGEKVKALVDKFEEQGKKDEEEKVQFTRSKSISKLKEVPATLEKKLEIKLKEQKPPVVKLVKKPSTPSTSSATPPMPTDDDKKRGKKREADDKSSNVEAGPSKAPPTVRVSIGDKLKVFYGPTNESKVTYEAKVIEIDKDQVGQVYLVHYTGWNNRYDEWIQPQRIAENLSATTKAKRSRQSASASTSKGNSSKPPPKRGRLTSVSARSSTTEAPRSTTPSSVTSSSSRTKSPATPATRSMARLTRQDSLRRTRRISAQTDNSNHTESDSEGSGSDSELSKAASVGAKSEEPEIKTYKRRAPKPPVLMKMDKRKERDDDDTEKEEEPEKPTRRLRKVKRSPEKSTEESEDDTYPPKGRDFDLNQIRSELKGFSKAIPTVPLEKLEKEVISSSEDSDEPPPLEKPIDIEEQIEEEKEDKPLEKFPSSEDIYEFKEPEPFEFESRSKLGEDKKRLVPRIFEDLDKSPKRRVIKNSPEKTEKAESPERRLFRRLPLPKQEDSVEDSDEDDDEEEEETLIPMSPPKEEEDPFDKLVESPSFNIVKTIEKVVENKEKVVRNISEDSLSLFRELPETIEDYSGDMELSDCESQTEIFTTSPEKMAREGVAVELFSDPFSKPSPDHNTLDMEFSSGKTDECKTKDSDDEDSIREQIQRVIARSPSTDDDSNDALMIRPPSTSFQVQVKDAEPVPTMASILGVSILDVPAPKVNKVVEEPKPIVEELPEEAAVAEEEKESPPVVVEKSVFALEKQQISPALQETDSSLLESIVSQPPVSLDVKLEETAKELSNVKIGTKIADSILQKLNSIKNEMEAKREDEVEEVEEEKKTEFKFEMASAVPKEETQAQAILEKIKPTLEEEIPIIIEESNTDDLEEVEEEEDEIPSPPIEEPVKKRTPSPKLDPPDPKKRKKTFVEETDSDSSDSEQLVIARSDEDSQTNSLDIKLQLDPKESDSSNMFTQMQTTDESQSQEERNFNFDVNEEEKVREPSPPPPAKEEEQIEEPELAKEEEPDPHLHSLLLCEEEIPRSPAPPSECPNAEEPKPAEKSILEMPFASAPGSSNSSKMMLMDQKVHQHASPPVLEIPVEREMCRVEASTVMDNTPPTTPESTLSNLSPREEIGGLSPNAGDNESCKSNDIEPEYPRQRRGSLAKVSPYSEEDTQMTGESAMKKLKDLVSASCKKRRKSLRSSDDTMPSSIKRIKKSQNRSRHNSDSDDTSEHSNTGSAKIPSYDRSNRSPRPSKYNFFVEFDPSLDSGQRIAVLQQKLSELRKTYADVKAELAAVERRRKKIRRREREALKAAKQEMACA